MSRKRLIWIMALAALSVLAVGAPVAQASHRDDTMADAECVLDLNQVAGAAALAGENGVNSVFQDTGFGNSYDPLELMDTDPGHFNFRGTARCEGRDVASEGPGLPAPGGPPNAPGPEIIPPGQYLIIASGDFDNLICGTGTANGDAVIKGPLPFNDSPPAPPPLVPPDVQIFTEFAIKFNGGVGGGTTPPFTGKLVFVVDADEGDSTADINTVTDTVGGQIETRPDGAETWPGSDMGGGPGGDEYPKNGGHSYANVGGNGNQIDGGGGSGDITITPQAAGGGGECVQPGTPTNPDAGNVKAFLVNGKFEGFLSGEGSTVSDDLPLVDTDDIPPDPSDDSDG